MMEHDDAYRKAEHRAAAKFGFFIHLGVYIAVNIVLVAVNLGTAPGYIWFKWPMLGWGIGLAFHGFAVFIGPRMMKHMIEKELKNIKK
jgi:hypothetical protein